MDALCKIAVCDIHRCLFYRGFYSERFETKEVTQTPVCKCHIFINVAIMHCLLGGKFSN